jgi:hypothetical protein
MTDPRINLSKNKMSEIKDFAWNEVEFFVTNSQKGISIFIKFAGNFNIKSRRHVLYFRVEKKYFEKKRIKIKNVHLSRSKFIEIYEKLDQVRIRSIIPSVDYALVGPGTGLKITRGNSQISINWIYGTQSKWKRLDELTLFVLSLCGEKNILTWKYYGC